MSGGDLFGLILGADRAGVSLLRPCAPGAFLGEANGGRFPDDRRICGGHYFAHKTDGNPDRQLVEGNPPRLLRWLRPVERGIYRVCGVNPVQEMTWKAYAAGVMLFSLAGVVFLYALQRIQGSLPGNPDSMSGVEPRLAFNTAVSFVTNTNWQSY